MTWNNNLTEALGIEYPIIQAPMLGVTTPEMVAAIANQGGLGSLPVGGLSPEVTQQLIRKTKSLTNKAFAVNLFVHEIPAYSESDLAPMKELLLLLANKRGYNITETDLSNFTLYSYREQLEVLVQEGITIVSFTFGCLDNDSIRLLNSKGVTLIGTATCVEEALYLEKQGIDMLTIQGIEAGGHRGTFIENIPLPQIGLFSLLQQVVELVKIPCIAAGGINSAKAIKAAFDLGAAGVQIGTAFIGTKESNAIPSYKAKVKEASATETALTKAFSGRWARGLRNVFMDEVEQSGISIPEYPLQNALTAQIRKLAQQNNDSDYTSLWAGQSVGNMQITESKEVFLNFVKQFEQMSK